MVPSNILQRTFRIQFRNSTGTAFTLDLHGRQYLITAKHVVPDLLPGETVGIQRGNEWLQIPAVMVGAAEDELDISVLALPLQLSPTHPLVPKTADIVLGQDIYFLGYPYGLYTEGGPDFNASFPLPLVKKGIVSSFTWANQRLVYLLLDGHNNPGFSGGPVYYTPPGSSFDCRVAGVISGYRYEWHPVFQEGQTTPLMYQYNTGIIIAIGIQVAVDLINANPVGFTLPL